MSEREILFRGKDLQEQNGWLYGYFYKSDINKRERESGKATLVFTPNCDTFIYVPEYHNSWMVKPETVGQYTGLTDRDGLTKIFEGDIVTCDYFCGVVYFHEGTWCVTEEDNYPEYLYDLINLKIIGNIHDNPELLKGD
jgi:uncharacterized phage protein (TIGR01671 family)